MTSRKIRVATRKSKLALAQTRAWIATLVGAHPGLVVEELHVTTTGDRIQDRALREVGGKGLFIKEIEEALLDGRADLAVHSMKDVPAEVAGGLEIGCVPPRVDPRDALICRGDVSFEDLPTRASVGTASLRRAIQLRELRDDIDVVPLRGNVDTRLRKCEEGVVDVVVLAVAGLARLGILQRVTQALEPEQCLPAIGQGALAIERRSDDREVADLLAPLADPETAIAVSAERGVQLTVEGSCDVPVAGYAKRDPGGLWVRALLAEPDGSNLRRAERHVPWPDGEATAFRVGEDLGRELAAS